MLFDYLGLDRSRQRVNTTTLTVEDLNGFPSRKKIAAALLDSEFLVAPKGVDLATIDSLIELSESLKNHNTKNIEVAILDDEKGVGKLAVGVINRVLKNKRISLTVDPLYDRGSELIETIEKKMTSRFEDDNPRIFLVLSDAWMVSKTEKLNQCLARYSNLEGFRVTFGEKKGVVRSQSIEKNELGQDIIRLDLAFETETAVRTLTILNGEIQDLEFKKMPVLLSNPSNEKETRLTGATDMKENSCSYYLDSRDNGPGLTTYLKRLDGNKVKSFCFLHTSGYDDDQIKGLSPNSILIGRKPTFVKPLLDLLLS